MADVRLTPSLPAVATPTPARSTEAVRAAQRAFFNTALANADSPAPARPAAPVAAAQAPAPATPLRAAPAVQATDARAPSRPLRPGSLLDIRI